MATRYTSRVGSRGEALFDALQLASWPPHPTTGALPEVTFADVDPDVGAENVCIVLDVEQTSIEWARSGPAGRDETITMLVMVRCRTPAEESTLKVWQRLTELADVVQGIVYDTDTNTVVALVDDESEVYGGRVSAVSQRVEGGADGWTGTAVVEFTFRARI